MKMTDNGGFDKSGPEQSRLESFCFLISILISIVIVGLFVVPYLAGPSKHPATAGKNEIFLAERINPNYASVASLARLPGVGMARAEAIVAYRNDFAAANNKKAYQNYKDLENVRGIGPKTTQKISEWLKFE
jgi:competence ComEA-like helix-hairpin-helix protein